MTAVNPEGETTDLEVFAKHIHSESLKLVWRGKPKHKPDMADALASGDWLTGGKELGKSLVRGLAKTVRVDTLCTTGEMFRKQMFEAILTGWIRIDYRRGKQRMPLSP